eukprot:TRINITY_DN4534_c0_g1_i1.p1 TRINITY_DN4534_c0_g1~~TRINITY_DN4534_c0_g1_i1.p1  ORF type:complete len:490 (-),score=96.55 TRINITY_DN4534_c0_g1_i1:153-1622(-)
MAHVAPPQIHIQDGAETEQMLHPDPVFPQLIVPSVPRTHLEPFGPPEVDEFGQMHAPRRMSTSHSSSGQRSRSRSRSPSPTRQADFAKRPDSGLSAGLPRQRSLDNAHHDALSPNNSPSNEHRRQLSPRMDAPFDQMGPPRTPSGGLGEIQRAPSPRTAPSPRAGSPMAPSPRAGTPQSQQLSPQSYHGGPPHVGHGFDSPLTPGRRSADEILNGHLEHRDLPSSRVHAEPVVDPVFMSQQRSPDEILYGHRKQRTLEDPADSAEPVVEYVRKARSPTRSPRKAVDPKVVSPGFARNAVDADEILTPGGAFLAIEDDADAPRAAKPHLSSDRPHARPPRELREPRSSLEIQGHAAEFHTVESKAVDGPVAASVSSPSPSDERRPKLLSPEYLDGPAEWPEESPTHHGDAHHRSAKPRLSPAQKTPAKPAHADSGLSEFLHQQHEKQHETADHQKVVPPPLQLGALNPEFAAGGQSQEQIVWEGGAYLKV